MWSLSFFFETKSGNKLLLGHYYVITCPLIDQNISNETPNRKLTANCPGGGVVRDGTELPAAHPAPGLHYGRVHVCVLHGVGYDGAVEAHGAHTTAGGELCLAW